MANSKKIISNNIRWHTRSNKSESRNRSRRMMAIRRQKAKATINPRYTKSTTTWGKYYLKNQNT